MFEETDDFGAALRHAAGSAYRDTADDTFELTEQQRADIGEQNIQAAHAELENARKRSEIGRAEAGEVRRAEEHLRATQGAQSAARKKPRILR